VGPVKGAVSVTGAASGAKTGPLELTALALEDPFPARWKFTVTVITTETGDPLSSVGL
jgi:hypothetical protein